MVREPDATMQPAPQDNQLMAKHRVLSFKPHRRLEWRGQDGHNEKEQPNHSASLGDSITSSTRIRFSVHTTSGIWLTTDLFPRLGITEKINVEVTPRGTDAAAMVAAGDANLAVLPTSEIMYAAGVDFAGNIAPEIQFVQTFSAAIVAGSREIEGSKRLIEFLTSARASEAIRKTGMEPLAP
jgi:ABC-type molybdate transport system substrate-binding protein